MRTVNTSQRANLHTLIILILLSAITTGCNIPTPTPTEQPLVDAFFSGYAYLDVNGNGEIDSSVHCVNASGVPANRFALIITSASE